MQDLFDSLGGVSKTSPSPLSPRERGDREFKLLQGLSKVLESTGFHELSTSTVREATNERSVGGVRVSTDASDWTKANQLEQDDSVSK